MNPGVRLAEKLAKSLGKNGTLPIAPHELPLKVLRGEVVIMTAKRAEALAQRLQRQEAELRRLRRTRKGSRQEKP